MEDGSRRTVGDLTSEYDESRYYFCSPGCKVSFDKDPEPFA